jgi:histidine triad (HIT) family protein
MQTDRDQLAADCVFCRIIARNVAAAEVYRDELVTAFLDHQPATPGHVLVVANVHIASFASVPDELGARLFRVARRLSTAIRSSGLPCDGVNVLLADGEAAFQDVPHVHVHVIPRTAGDGFSIDSPAWHQPQTTIGELVANARLIRQALVEIDDGRS